MTPIIGFYTPGGACGVTETLLQTALQLQEAVPASKILIVDANLQVPVISLLATAQGDSPSYHAYAGRLVDALGGVQQREAEPAKDLRLLAGTSIPVLRAIDPEVRGTDQGDYGTLLDLATRAELVRPPAAVGAILRMLYNWITTAYPSSILLVDMGRGLDLHSIFLLEHVLQGVVVIHGDTVGAQRHYQNFVHNMKQHTNGCAIFPIPMAELSPSRIGEVTSGIIGLYGLT